MLAHLEADLEFADEDCRAFGSGLDRLPHLRSAMQGHLDDRRG